MELFSLPKARTAVTAKLAGFIDLLMLVILGSSIESELTRFVITEAVVKGIIFLTEVAIVFLKARNGLNLCNHSRSGCCA